MAEAAIYEVYDPRFNALVVGSACLEELYSSCRWAEGPVWFDDAQQLLWSDIPNQRMLRWVPEGGVFVYRYPSSFANGHTRDRQGRLVSCEHGTRRVTRTETDGSITVLADSYQGKRLNSPNDVVVKSDGGIWFSDPTYGILSDYEGYKAEPEQPERSVYRLDPSTGELEAAASDFFQPNGLAFSPDETKLYVADSGSNPDGFAARHIKVYDVTDGTHLRNSRIFCHLDEGVPDGFRLDTDGNVWTSGGKAVHCFSPEGKLLGKIRIPQGVSNLTFGGPRRNRLFITATRSLYAIYVTATGAQTP